MRSEVVVDISPLVDDLACVIEREKDVLVQALLAELVVGVTPLYANNQMRLKRTWSDGMVPNSI